MNRIILLFLFIINITANAENIQIKTLATINNEIITNIDLKNEIEILAILNSNIKINDIKKVALDNLINEAVKKKEIERNKIDIDEKFIQNNLYNLINQLENQNKKISEKKRNLIYKKIELESKWNKLISNKYSWQLNINMQEIEKLLNNSQSINDKESIINVEKNKKLNVYSIIHLENLRKKTLIKIYK